MVCMRKNIANCPKIPQFILVKCALLVLCACCARIGHKGTNAPMGQV